MNYSSKIYEFNYHIYYIEKMINNMFPNNEIIFISPDLININTYKLALFYIYRIFYNNYSKNQNSVKLLRFTSKKFEKLFFIISLIIADKYLNDNHFSIQSWSNYIKVPSYIINDAQTRFLKLINYELNTNSFNKWEKKIYKNTLTF